jgi:hypothetical protein
VGLAEGCMSQHVVQAVRCSAAAMRWRLRVLLMVHEPARSAGCTWVAPPLCGGVMTTFSRAKKGPLISRYFLFCAVAVLLC